MSYEESLEAAGAVVHVFESFGSYQGEWYAKVTWNGETGWVSGYYGSCSGCDAFEAEFGWADGECIDHKWGATAEQVSNCSECSKAKADYQKHLADFGRIYLEGMMDQASAEQEAARYIEWDSDAAEMLEFVKKNA